MISRRCFLAVLPAIGCVTAAFPAASQSYPTRSITLVVPFPAGAATDAVARIVSEHMAKTLGQAIVIENDAGAGGTTATRRVARAAPDGYTISAGSMATHAAAVAQYANIKYDPAKDFTPIGLTIEAPAVIVTKNDFPANTLKEFVDYIRKNQATVNEGHGGVGSQMHTYCSFLHSLMGTKTTRVAYRGAAPALNDLVAGHVDFSCGSVSGVA
jgi:tripartite-type tricarboxylate transporter receptor subunit TctC